MDRQKEIQNYLKQVKKYCIYPVNCKMKLDT